MGSCSMQFMCVQFERFAYSLTTRIGGLLYLAYRVTKYSEYYYSEHTYVLTSELWPVRMLTTLLHFSLFWSMKHLYSVSLLLNENFDVSDVIQVLSLSLWEVYSLFQIAAFVNVNASNDCMVALAISLVKPLWQCSSFSCVLLDGVFPKESAVFQL